MHPARVHCEFCEKKFSKKANLTRHHNSNSCLARPNPDTVRPRCRYCNVQFLSRRVLKEHKRLKRCPGRRSLRRQQQPEQDTPTQQPSPQLPSHMASMSQQQLISWLTEFLTKNEGQVTQNLMQSAWAMVRWRIHSWSCRPAAINLQTVSLGRPERKKEEKNNGENSKEALLFLNGFRNGFRNTEASSLGNVCHFLTN